MNQTIQDFYQQASQRNFARDFQLRITGMTINGIQQIEEDDLVFLKTASLPGKTITVQNAPYMGLNFNIPGSVSYDGSNNWAVTFYCTQDYGLRELLEQSMSDSFDQETSTGNLEPRGLDEYKIELTLFDDQLNPVRTYSLLGCFVTNIGAINYNITGAGAIQEVTASIAYQYWVAEGEFGGSGIARGLRGAGAFLSAIGLGSVGNAISQAGRTVNSINRTVSSANSVVNQITNLFGGKRGR